MREKVEAALAKIRPSLGGTDIALIDASKGTVKVKIFTSSCAPGVPKEIAVETVEELLMEEVPEIKEVIAV